ncbi:hypothetical protein ACJVDH_14350 [Pedobacter sp. AW1-32]|uniref:hypothetical protein n=1 Tax=Pedobacter sp. AW1-32 TaxID=3383026 RepID=UPI003FF10B2F
MNLKSLLSCLLVSVAFYACSPKMYTEKPYAAGSLNDAQMDSLRTYLSQNERVKLEDTIFIKYDFNNDACWNDLEGQNPEFINNLRWTFQKNVQEKAADRPGIAIYQYAEAGNNFSAVKTKGLEIETDSGFLRKMLFKEKVQCGTTAIILPSSKFLLVKSDSHFAALLLNAKEIESRLIENLVN